jgi:hypothetical protein
MKPRNKLLVTSATDVSLSYPEGGEGRGEEGLGDWISPLPGPLPTPASRGEGMDHAVSSFPQSPDEARFPNAKIRISYHVHQ